MLVLGIMAFGVLLGAWLPLKKYLKINSKVQTISTAILIFIMGVSLGNRNNFWSELASMGWESILFSILPMIFSTIFVYWLAKLLFPPNSGH